MTDPIADMLTRIRNAAAIGKTMVSLPHSKIKEAIAKILKDSGFITGYTVEGEGIARLLMVELPADPVATKITTLKRISKPGRRVYAGSREIPTVLSGRGLVIVSTSGGLMTGQEARKRGLGGELICQVW